MVEGTGGFLTSPASCFGRGRKSDKSKIVKETSTSTCFVHLSTQTFHFSPNVLISNALVSFQPKIFSLPRRASLQKVARRLAVSSSLGGWSPHIVFIPVSSGGTLHCPYFTVNQQNCPHWHSQFEFLAHLSSSLCESQARSVLECAFSISVLCRQALWERIAQSQCRGL